MRLSKREISLIIILAVVAAVVLSYLYLYEPIMMEYNFAKDQYEKKNTELGHIQNNLMSKNEMEILILNFKNKVSVLEHALPPVIHQERVVMYIDSVFEKNNIHVTNTSFDDGKIGEESEVLNSEAPVGDILSEYEKLINNSFSNIDKYKDKTFSEDTKKEYDEFVVNLTFDGTYADIKSLMSDIESYNKKIIVKDLAMTKLSTSFDNVAATITLSFPYFYDNEVLKAINWPYDGNYGLEDPFAYEPLIDIINSTSGTNTNTNITDIINNINNGSTNVTPAVDTTPVVEPLVDSKPYKNPDFYMVLKPSNSDSPTTTMARYPLSYSILTAENSAVESTYLNLKKEDGEYKFQYGTMLQSYPSEDTYEVFVPYSGKTIYLEIKSQVRLPKEDLSTTSLVINNETDLTIEAHIEEDDKSFPRIIIKNNVGSFKIVNQD